MIERAPESSNRWAWALTFVGFALILLAWLVVAAGYRGGFFVPPFYRLLREDLKAVAPQLLSGAVGAVLLSALRTRSLSPAFAWVTDHPRAAAAFTIALALAISVGAYQRQPLAMDEVAPLFQARVLGSGQLAARFDPAQLPRLFGPGFLGVFYFFDGATGRIISAYWPGMALLLAPFELVGAGFVVNPLLAGSSVWLVRYVALALTRGDRAATGLAMALLVSAPAFVVNAASFYSMNAHVTANLAFVALLMRPTPRRLIGAGAVGGLALSLNNPLPHLLLGWPWWLFVLRGSGGLRRAAALAAGYLPVGLVLVVGWFLFSESLRGEGAALVGKSAVAAPSLGLLQVRAEGLAKLVLWAPFATIPLAVAGLVRHRREPRVRALALGALTLLIAYFGVKFDQGHGWGYRYFHPAFATLPLLGGLAVTEEPGEAPLNGREPLFRSAAGWCLAALGLLVPGRVLEVDRVVSAHRAQLLPAPAGQDCVHFVSPRGVSSRDLLSNDPKLRGHLRLFGAEPREVEAFRARYLPATRLIAKNDTDLLYCGDLDSYRALALGRSR